MKRKEIITRNEAVERGLMRYYTGKECVNGHYSERYTINCVCIECKNLHQEKTKKRANQIRERFKRK